jgi:4-diphosphocytidyl-2-C-methyl-D-erythritol kinase
MAESLMNGRVQGVLSLTLGARAKVNLRLEVLGLRGDGYHEVQTVLHTIDLRDKVAMRLSSGDARGDATLRVTCRPDLGLPEHANIAHRAALALLAAWRSAGGELPAGLRLEIDIEKAIPVAAGLGGGSADAAATLRGTMALLSAAGAGSSPVNLHLVAKAIGSDVPFLLQGGAAVGVGRGEALLPCASNLNNPLVLLAPPLAISAKDAYRWWDEDGANHPPLAGRPPGPGETLSVSPEWVGNELRPVVAARFPIVEELRRDLMSAGALAAEMTGSGPVVYGIFERQADAEAACGALARARPHVRAQLARLDPALAGSPALEGEHR